MKTNFSSIIFGGDHYCWSKESYDDTRGQSVSYFWSNARSFDRATLDANILRMEF